MLCPHCGRSVDAQDRFCKYCGGLLSVMPTPAAPPAPAEAAPGASPSAAAPADTAAPATPAASAGAVPGGTPSPAPPAPAGPDMPGTAAPQGQAAAGGIDPQDRYFDAAAPAAPPPPGDGTAQPGPEAPQPGPAQPLYARSRPTGGPAPDYGADYGDAGAYGFLRTDRSLLVFILLDLVTCGIYGLYFLYKLIEDVNFVCEGDGRHTPGLVQLLLLGLVTCGIYPYIWYYQLGDRLAANAPRYGLYFPENGTTLLLWSLLGSLLCGIGPYVALYLVIRNVNALCAACNAANGYGNY